MQLKQLQKINKINWVIFSSCSLVSVLIAIFKVFTFVPTNLSIFVSFIISGLFACYVGVMSALLWWKKLYPPEYKNKFKLSDMDNNLGLRLLFAIIAGLMMNITLSFATTGLYTYIFGTKVNRTERVLYKHAAVGKLKGNYSVKLTNIDRRINISVSDYYLLKKGEKTKIDAKKSNFGLLIHKFERI